MGRPNPVLEIAVAGEWMEHPAVKELIAAGHKVQPYPGPLNPDIILHPAAHGWSLEMFFSVQTKGGETRYPYLETALVGARKYHRGRKP